jgi:predicted protein tyrosine phosphatase
VQFIVTDRASIEAGIIVRTRYVLISVRSPGQRKARIPRQSALVATLFLVFDDAEPSDTLSVPDSIQLFSAKQAEKVKAFIEQQHEHVQSIVCQCEAGYSRSPAVAAAICRSFGGDNTSFFHEYQPNRFVYDVLIQVLNSP